MTAVRTGLVLVARGNVGAFTEDPELASTATALDDDKWCAAVGYLDGGVPTLTDALDELCAAGVERIVLLPVSVPTNRTVTSWVRRVATDWRARRPWAPPIALADRPGSDPAYAELLRRIAVGAPELPPTAPPLLSAAWERLPPFDRHVLVCLGPRCSALGATEVQRALTRRLAERDAGDDDVLLTRTGCLFPCSRGPVVTVYPDDVWFGGMTAEAAAALADRLADHDGLDGIAARTLPDPEAPSEHP